MIFLFKKSSYKFTIISIVVLLGIEGIGFIGFKGVPDVNGYSEVGYSISPNYRKKRFMTKALETSINWAYEFQEAKSITAKVLKTNVGSIKVLNNCNFKLGRI